MPTACPKCAAAISPWKVRHKFVCEQCRPPLKSNSHGILAIAVIAWTLVENGIKSLVLPRLGDSAVGIAVSTFISGVFGLSLYCGLVLLSADIEVETSELADD